MSEADQVPGPATETRPSLAERLQNRKTRTKLIIFFSILIILVIVMSLIVYFCLRRDKSKHAYYENKTLGSLPRPHLEYRTWLLPSKHWNAVQVDHHRTDRFLKLVVINHSVMHGCHGKKACADELFRMQRYFREHRGWKDMPYNFAIGQAGNVYEGRGWAAHGAHTRSFNNCSLGIGFLGQLRSRVDCPPLLREGGLAGPARRTRHTPLLHVPLCRTNYAQNTVLTRITRTYNKHFSELDLYDLPKPSFKNKVNSLVTRKL
ncbi:unnamed protein product [Plutella xylostella]|uniref:(diamondback moth) hypothetical protein n=1 Tax=Plutella xylostella TaxID=51655 RepID=A0A8S4GB05_PLUXY|nr:unnamed protein product [Plutella xylostella]